MNIFNEDVSLEYFDWVDSINEAIKDEELIAKIDKRYR